MFDPKNLILDNPDEGVFRVHRSAMTSLEVLRMEQERIFRQMLAVFVPRIRSRKPGRLPAPQRSGATAFLHPRQRWQAAGFSEHMHAPRRARFAGTTGGMPTFCSASIMPGASTITATSSACRTRPATRPVSTELRWVSSRRRAWKATAVLSLSASIRMSKSS